MKLLLAEQTLTNEEYDDFEVLVGGNLGNFFRSFYLENNGGVPTHEYYEEFNIQVFSPIKYGDWTIEQKLESFREQHPDKLSYVPFGHDGGANPYFLNYKDGTIHILCMGEEDLSFVAESFEELVNGLTEEME